jgi:hypothetical protein
MYRYGTGMIRHVIVEGPDGAGKSTLVDYLCNNTGLVRHERASTSVGGPVTDLHGWFNMDFSTMDSQPPSVYDRHPIISEPIYSRWARHVMPQPPFDSPAWVTRWSQSLANKALVVWCVPRIATVYDNVRKADQMPGVTDHILDIYASYQRAVQNWPGVMATYNYEKQVPGIIVARVASIITGVIK